MSKKSAGLIMYHFKKSELEILLVHPGGPYWKNKDEGAWSIPKGEYSDDEEPFKVAKREFKEETGYDADGHFITLSPVKQPGGKIVSAWAFEGDCDAEAIVSNTFFMEWPPRSGKQDEFPEVDRAEWFRIATAKTKILKGQKPLVNELCNILKYELKKEPEDANISSDVKSSKKEKVPIQQLLFK